MTSPIVTDILAVSFQLVFWHTETFPLSGISRQQWKAGQSYKVLTVTAIVISRYCQAERIRIITKCLRTNWTKFVWHLAILDRTRSLLFQHQSAQYQFAIKRVGYFRVWIYSTNSLNFSGESEVGFGLEEYSEILVKPSETPDIPNNPQSFYLLTFCALIQPVSSSIWLNFLIINSLGSIG